MRYKKQKFTGKRTRRGFLFLPREDDAEMQTRWLEYAVWEEIFISAGLTGGWIIKRWLNE